MIDTEFVERLSETIAMEIDEVLSSSVKYENDVAKEIIVMMGNGTKLKIAVSHEFNNGG